MVIDETYIKIADRRCYLYRAVDHMDSSLTCSPANDASIDTESHRRLAAAFAELTSAV